MVLVFVEGNSGSCKSYISESMARETWVDRLVVACETEWEAQEGSYAKKERRVDFGI